MNRDFTTQPLNRLDGEGFTATPAATTRPERAPLPVCATVAPKLAPGGWREMTKTDHFVQIYEKDAHLLRALNEYVADGLWQGARAIIIATPAHRLALEERLRATGIDVASAIVTRQLVVADAEETLGRFMIGDEPDAALFNDSVGAIVRSTARGNRAIRAFGEMVALLWQRGNRHGAIRLEALWNELARTADFSLFCAYPENCFGDDAAGDALRDVCTVHSRIILPDSFAA